MIPDRESCIDFLKVNKVANVSCFQVLASLMKLSEMVLKFAVGISVRYQVETKKYSKEGR